MNVQTYRAATMREALDVVRRELGGDAIVLSARQVPLKRRFPWQRARCEAEVVAGLAEQTAPLRSGAVRHRQDPPADTQNSDPDPSRESLKSSVDSIETTPVAEAEASLFDGWDRVDSPDAAAVHPAPDASPSEAMDALIAQLGRHADRDSRREIPDELFHAYAELIDADVAEDDARSLIFQLRSSVGEGALDARSSADRLAELVSSRFQCNGGIAVTPGVRRVVALVGPTGVGKTTSIAKLAANFKLRDGIRVGLVTVDTYRVAAVEQLRTYAEIIDLPMHVVTTAREMRHALEERSDLDLVLIDTAGRSPRDELKIHELKTLLAEAGVDEVHLVLSAASSIRSLERAAQRFSTVGPTAVLLTKLDEVGALGCLYSAARRVGLPISYFTTGQDVPDDIEAASPQRATRLILGEEGLFPPKSVFRGGDETASGRKTTRH